MSESSNEPIVPSAVAVSRPKNTPAQTALGCLVLLALVGGFFVWASWRGGKLPDYTGIAAYQTEVIIGYFAETHGSDILGIIRRAPDQRDTAERLVDEWFAGGAPAKCFPPPDILKHLKWKHEDGTPWYRDETDVKVVKRKIAASLVEKARSEAVVPHRGG